MWREPSPSYRARKAKLIEPLRIIVCDPSCQNLPFPRICGNLETLKLLQHFQRATLAIRLRSWSHMLPTQKPSHKLSRCYGFNLLTQHPDGQPVDPSQKPPLAP